MSSSEFLVKVFYGDEVLVEYILPQGSTIVLDVAACAREMGVPSRFVTFATTAGVELERTAVNDSSSSSPTVEYNTPAAWCNLMQTGLVIGKLVVYATWRERATMTHTAGSTTVAETRKKKHVRERR